MKTKLFMDGAELSQIKHFAKDQKVQGFTTNPSLMCKAGIKDYTEFAKQAIRIVGDKPISFEVFSDDFKTMEKEAHTIWGWGGPIYVKIPITNTKGESSIPLIKKLSLEGIALNITAIFTLKQVEEVAKAVSAKSKTIVSVFAGRIADTGVDPEPMMKESSKILKPNQNAELLWASSRELLNIFQAERCGCHIITVTPDILKKLSLIGKDMEEYSLETVLAFYNDAKSAGFNILEENKLQKSA